MEDVYNLTTVRKPAKPRSRDLQDTNAPATGGGAVMTVEGGAAYMPDTATTTANHARTADTANKAKTADTATTAQRAEKSATAEALQTANFNAGASGARVADDGSAEVETLTVRGFIKAAEYLINRIKITEGAQWLTEGGVIERVETATPQNGAQGGFALTMRERFAGDTQAPFVVGDILRGQYNNLQGGGGVQTSWMRVQKVEGRVVTVGFYQSNQVPGGANAQPIVQMRVARWGNASDTTRQSHIVLDPKRGQIVRRVNVNAPIIDPAQVDGFSLGTLPTWVQNALGGAVNENSNYLYARGIITQDIIRFSPQGQPIAERVDRGVWSAQQSYYHEGKNNTTGIYEISRVWLDGTLYELAPRGDGSTRPSAKNTHWIVVQEKPKDGTNGADGLTPMPNLLKSADFDPKNVSVEEPTNEGHVWRVSIANGGIIRHEPNVTAPHASAKVVSCESFNRSTSEETRECYASLFQEVNVVEGVTYTFSAYVKGADAGYMIAYPIDGTHFKISGANPIDEGQNTAEGWKRYAVTFKARSSGKTLIMVRSWSRNKDEAGGKVYFACPKLEESYKPTPWTRAQEDFRGERGRTTYFHIKYSNDGGQNFTANDGETVGDYIGQCTDFNEIAPNSPSAYKWSKTKGEQGQRGADGADGLTPMPNLLKSADFDPKNVSNDAEHNEGFAWRAEAANGGIVRHEPNVMPPHAGAKVVSCESFQKSTDENNVNCVAGVNQEAEVVEGRSYTFSVYVKGAAAGYMIAWPIDGTHFKISGANSIDEGNNTAEGWKRYAVTFKARSSGKTNLILRSWCNGRNDGNGGKVFFACPKLEESYQPTPWTRAQEDFRGAAMRPLGDWDALPDGFQFQSGGVGEEFIDMVSVKSEGALLWWSCKRSHAKTKDTRPNVNAPFWELGQNLKFVATDLLLAKEAVIEGNILASSMSYKAEEDEGVIKGALIFQDGKTHILPKLREGEVREIRVMPLPRFHGENDIVTRINMSDDDNGYITYNTYKKRGGGRIPSQTSARKYRVLSETKYLIFLGQGKTRSTDWVLFDMSVREEEYRTPEGFEGIVEEPW